MQLSRSRAHTGDVQDDARSRLNGIAKMQLSRSRVCIEAEHRGNACDKARVMHPRVMSPP